MGLDLEFVDGQTPLDEEEKEGLLIPTVTTRGELDEFEQFNIEKAVQWTVTHRFKREEILTEKFIRKVHKKMYGEVWAWAGEFRKTNKNLGIDKYQIPIQLKSLLEDCSYWIDQGTYSPDETAIRFKHRLVSIHCFSNGNGRHSRLMADLIVNKIFGRPVFSWGAKDDLAKDLNARRHYLHAIRAADENDIELLVKFARN